KAPPSKKARESGKQEAKKSSSQDSQSTASQNLVSNRKPLDERLHERDLEAALTLSLLNSSNEREDQAKGVAKVQVVADENTDPTSLYLSNCSVDSTVLGLDEISAEKESLVKQRKAAAKAAAESRKTLKDEDEDYEPKASPESDSDFSEPAESEDEEFTVKNVSKTKKRVKEKSRQVKAAPASKKAKPAPQPAKVKSPGGGTYFSSTATPVRSPPVAKVAHKRPASSSAVPASRPALSPIPAGGRVPKWNPPAQVGRSPSSSQSTDVRSPGQGLRLGLSRLVRVKPLHPSVASH
uniref:RAD51 associated protein 1 n=1 Tax=Takifugu rubripes TaxID=31033 RepID=A0A3B5K376_TAKRU